MNWDNDDGMQRWTMMTSLTNNGIESSKKQEDLIGDSQEIA